MTVMSRPKIDFIDLKKQQDRIRPQIDAAVKAVLDHGQYIMGPEVGQLEKDLVAFTGAKHCISCANGTDALGMALMAKGVGPGDAVLVPSFTFASTAEVVAWVGATPIFVDILPDTMNMDSANLDAALAAARKAGVTPKAIVPVDLFGQPAEYDAIEAFAAANGLWVMADGAQSFGCTYKGRNFGTIGLVATTSFFPAKPLGCYGDGGAIFTNDDEVANLLKSIRIHGKGTDKYDNVRIGINGRLDTMQAAILIEKLKIYADEIKARQTVAERYNAGLADVIQVPKVIDGGTSVWAQYTLVLDKAANRDAVLAKLKDAGVPTAVYYPKPLHQQTAYKHYPSANGGLPVSEDLAGRVFSLPMHPYLTADEQAFIIEGVRAAVR